jgi:succinate dehydrogenase / fumarate reductase cytochrome b subunit
MIQRLNARKPAAEPIVTTIGAKVVMALTGIALLGFVVFHMLGNLQIFLGQDAVNKYAKFLKDQGPLLWLARVGLLAIFLLHIVISIRLQWQRARARPIPYVFRNTIKATLASRTMLTTGLLILAFVLFHLAHFTLGYVHQATIVRPGADPVVKNFLDLKDPLGRHDVYSMTIYGFMNPYITILYVIAMLFLGFHLSHGIASMFQTLGFRHPRYTPWIERLSAALMAVIVIGNCSMPLAVVFGFIKLPG